jgi:hypothetical protein
MVAMPAVDFIVAATWVGLLVLVLVARATASWFKYRRAMRIARDAERLEMATRPVAAVAHLPQPHSPDAAVARPQTRERGA